MVVTVEIRPGVGYHRLNLSRVMVFVNMAASTLSRVHAFISFQKPVFVAHTM
jgi:hypothetical protein